MKLLSSISIVLLSFAAGSQTGGNLEEREDRLDSLLTNLRDAKNNDEKKERNLDFKAELESFVEVQGAFDYEFTKLQTVGVIDSPDNLVRIINWNVELDDLSHEYYCYVLRFDKRKYLHTELKDVSFGMPSQPTEMVTQDNWYGALYYKIIPIQKGARTMYTLIGWDHNSSLSQVKLLDVMYFSGSNVKLGSPVFKIGNSTQYRVFYEHSKKVNMYINYEDNRSRIMMDHLSPESPALKGFRSYYVPDLSYDSFTYEDNKWVLKEDVIGVNRSDGEDQSVVVLNNETGELERRIIENEWLTPDDVNAPGGSTAHVAVTPEEREIEGQKTVKEANELDSRINKRDKRDPNALSSFGKSKKSARKLKRENRRRNRKN
ncbi:MAG: hypothetical protein ACJAUD_002290 [Crocinitomicaceae bacterium]|jgi:hypothetical protein